MAKSRIDLHNIFVDLLETKSETETRVYFQPPATIKLKYPCIIYKRSNRRDFFSNNRKYLGMMRYDVTIVDKNPDSDIPEKVAQLPYTEFSSHFTVDGLNHDIYTIYF